MQTMMLSRELRSQPLGGRSSLNPLYVRRRLIAVVLIGCVLFVATLSVRTVLADRGAVPAASSAVRHETPMGHPSGVSVVPASAGVASYIVQPGDTLWAIGQRFHGSVDVATYVDRLVSSHGNATLQVGEAIALP